LHSHGSSGELPLGLQRPTLPVESVQGSPHGQVWQTPSTQVAPTIGSQPGGQIVPSAVVQVSGHLQHTPGGQLQSALQGVPPGQTLLAALPGSHCSPGSISPSPQISLLAGAQSRRSFWNAMVRRPN
jgi:hypothetical protein